MTDLNDPMMEALLEPINAILERGAETNHQKHTIIPGQSRNVTNACLAEIRNMSRRLTVWKPLKNGMTAGQFAYLYIYHFKRRRGVKGAIRVEQNRK